MDRTHPIRVGVLSFVPFGGQIWVNLITHALFRIPLVEPAEPKVASLRFAETTCLRLRKCGQNVCSNVNQGCANVALFN